MKLDTNLHSVFLLNYHLIFVTKYRKKVIDDVISQRIKDIFERIAKDYNISLIEWNHDLDHIHILFKAHPNSEISKFINAYKSASSRLVTYSHHLTLSSVRWWEYVTFEYKKFLTIVSM